MLVSCSVVVDMFVVTVQYVLEVTDDQQPEFCNLWTEDIVLNQSSDIVRINPLAPLAAV